MTYASMILWSARGSPALAGVEAASGVCWVCAHTLVRGLRVDSWQSAKFTGQTRVRRPSASHVCEPCAWAMSGRPPDTLRMTSHLWGDGEGYAAPNKGDKPAILRFLRAAHAGAWLAAIADSGKKHVVPWTPVNPPGTRRGRVLFEDRVVVLPGDAAGWNIVDRLAALLTAGATKDEVARGEWSPRAWALLGGATIETFEADFGRRERGGVWFDLALWLAQRDEEAVADRLAAEKEKRRGRRS